FLFQKPLVQHPTLALPLEFQRDGWRSGRIPPGLQIFSRRGFEALKERGADGPHQRALARLVGTGEQIDARVQRADFHRLAKPPDLLHPQPQEPHWDSPASLKRPARITSASRAVSAAASAPSCC